ncbi:restriction endonuclease subunit S [Tenacibaculum maritimum]|uniref:restriction endonuclease subunit S n=1 Tax=Tenacibaculum maritimum TaxID=107401 RepID=UPI00387762D3
MELATKQGFKQTEVGLIPEDWEVVAFDKIFTYYSTSNYSKAQMSEVDEVGCIHYGLIHAIPNTQYDLNNGIKYYVTSEQAKYEYVRNGDVIMVDASEDLEGINKSVEVFGIGDKKYISGLHTYLLRDKKGLLADKFRGIVLNSQFVKNQMLQLAVGMKVFGVSKTQLAKVKIPLPPTLKEQKAIATALSDVDDLIVSLEDLIAKKQAIKQGAMQQLLTPPHKGGKRLPGFSGDWVEKTIEELSKTFTKQTGFDYSNHIKPILLDKVQRNTYPFIQNKDFDGYNINFDTDYYIPCEVAEKFPRILLNEKCLLISISGSIGKVGVFNNKQTAFIGGAVAVGKFLEKDLLDWVMLYLKSEAGQNLMLKDVKAGSHQNLILDDIRKMKIPIPPKNEQIEVCGILKDIQKDIEQLETKKAKYQQLKQGMLQELLTGNTRLV